MQLLIRRLLLTVLIGVPLASLAPAQSLLGPPRGFFGQGPGDSTQGGPGDRGGTVVTDGASWTRWWTFNREPFLASLRVPDAGEVRAAELGGEPSPLPPYRPSERRIHTEVVPLLRERLAKTKDLDLAAACLMALAKIGDPPRDLARAEDLPSVAPLIEARLRDSNERVRDIAVLSLGILGDPRHVPLLSSIASDQAEGHDALGTRRIDLRTRAFATVALGRYGFSTLRESQRTSVAGHLLALAESEREEADIATAAIVSVGWSPLTLQPTPTSDEEPREGLERMVIRLLALFEDRETDVRARAQLPVALARLVGEAEFAADAKDVAATRERLRRVLITRLTEAIAERGGERNASVREGAVQALGLVVRPRPEAMDRTAIEALLRVTETGQEREGGLAWVAIARIGGRAGKDAKDQDRLIANDLRSKLGIATAEGPVSRRPWAALGLGLLDHEAQARGAAPALGSQALLRNRLGKASSPEATSAAAIALGLAGDPEAVKPLVAGLDQGDFQIRGLHATALALLQTQDAIGALRDIAASNIYRPYLLRDTSTALALLGDPDLVQLLVNKLVQARFMPERLAAVGALAWVQDSAALPALTFLLREKRVARRNIDDTTRAFAAAALGSLCAREVLPWNTYLAQDLTWSAVPLSLTDPDDGGGILDLF